MKYFVWLMTTKGPTPQKWDEDYTLNPNSKKLNTELRVLRKEQLSDEQQDMTLNQLSTLYPCPSIKSE